MGGRMAHYASWPRRQIIICWACSLLLCSAASSLGVESHIHATNGASSAQQKTSRSLAQTPFTCQAQWEVKRACDKRCDNTPYRLASFPRVTFANGQMTVNLEVEAHPQPNQDAWCTKTLYDKLFKMTIRSQAMCKGTVVSVTLNGQPKRTAVYFDVLPTESILRITNLPLNSTTAVGSQVSITLREPCNTLEAFAGGPALTYYFAEASDHLCCNVNEVFFPPTLPTPAPGDPVIIKDAEPVFTAPPVASPRPSPAPSPVVPSPVPSPVVAPRAPSPVPVTPSPALPSSSPSTLTSFPFLTCPLGYSCSAAPYTLTSLPAQMVPSGSASNLLLCYAMKAAAAPQVGSDCFNALSSSVHTLGLGTHMRCQGSVRRVTINGVGALFQLQSSRVGRELSITVRLTSTHNRLLRTPAALTICMELGTPCNAPLAALGSTQQARYFMTESAGHRCCPVCRST